MTCAEFQDQVAAFALGAVEANERVELDAHLATGGPHSGCEEALDKALATAAALSGALPPTQPDERVWQAIEARLSGADRERSERRLSPRELVGWALAVAAAVGMVFLGAALVDRNRVVDEASHALAQTRADLAQARSALDQARSQQAQEKQQLMAQIQQLRQEQDPLSAEAMALLDRPAARLVPFKAVKAGCVANAIVSPEDHRAIVISNRLPAHAGKDLELWVIRGKGAPIPAGLMKVSPKGIAMGEIPRELLSAGMPDAFAVSLEALGGAPKPTVVLLVGELKNKRT
jgi:anti-sigma-K factor RskA